MKLQIKENIPLAPYSTFKIGGPARFFCAVTNDAELLEAVQFAKEYKLRLLTLGGGSNILVSDKGFPGLVIKNEYKGREVVSDTADLVTMRVGAGELWDSFVEYAVEQELFGIENLSAIPGSVGAVPVQNVGAYGAEASQTVKSVRVLDTETNKFLELDNTHCKFGYRDSLFKQVKGRYIITEVSFALRRHGQVDISYKDLSQYFANRNPSQAPSILEVRKAVIDIRWNKLPDWKLWGTAGSYFKNPIITSAHYDRLKKAHPNLPSYKQSDGRIKIPVGWILEHLCGTKGEFEGRVGSYKNQALVVVTKPGSTATEVVEYTSKLMHCVEEKTGIKLEAEVEWVN